MSYWTRLRTMESKAADKGVPCEICIRVEKLQFLIQQCSRRPQRLQKLLTAKREAETTHPKCAYCGLLFWGEHYGVFAGPVEGFPSCQDCQKDYRKGLLHSAGKPAFPSAVGVRKEGKEEE